MAVRRMVSIACLVALTQSAAALGQDATSQAPAAALDSIDRALKEIVELLRVQVGNQRTELAVRRLDIASREVAARERESYEAEAERDGYAQSLEGLTETLEMYSGAPPADIDMTDEQLDVLRNQFERQIETAKQNLFRADQRLIDLRQGVTRLREDLLTWEEIVAASFVDE